MTEDVCGGISFASQEGECEEHEIVVGRWSLLQSKVSAVHGYCFRRSAETLALFLNTFGDQLLKDVLGYDPSRKDRTSVKGNIMCVAGLDAWVPTVVLCLAQKKTCVGRCHKEYIATHRTMVETETKQLIWNSRFF